MLSLFAPAPARALRLAWRALSFLTLANWLYAAFIVGIAVALVVAPDATMTTLGVRTDVSRARILPGFFALAAIGLASVVLIHRLLRTLRALVATIADGDPFVAANADRLDTLGRLLLGLELLHLGVGAITSLASTAQQPLDVDWNFTFTPWLTILLVFVLAQVFREGARMRRELDGVV